MSDLRADQLAPHSVEAEEAVLGAILINPDALYEVLSFLSAEDFYVERHAWIWEAMLALHERRDPIDYLLVVSELEQGGRLTEVGGAAYLLSLINKTPSALNVEGYGRIVARMAWRRRVILYAGRAARLAHSEETNIATIHEKLVAGLADLGGGAGQTLQTAHALGEAFLDDLETGGGQAAWVTGLGMLDRLLGSTYFPGSFTVVGAYTEQGKTQLAVQMALAAAQQGPTLYVTLESVAERIQDRQLALLSGIPATRIRQARSRQATLDGEERDWLVACVHQWQQLPLGIHALFAVSEIERAMGEMQAMYDFAPGMVFVDDIDTLAEHAGQGNVYANLRKANSDLLSLAVRRGWGVVGFKQFLPPTAARNTQDSARLLALLWPTVLSFEGGPSVGQKGGNLVGLLGADWIRQKIWSKFQHADLPPGMVMCRLLKRRDEGVGEITEIPLRWNAQLPRFEDVPVSESKARPADSLERARRKVEAREAEGIVLP